MNTSANTRPHPEALVAWLCAAAALLWIGSYLQHPAGEGISIRQTMEVVVDNTASWRFSHLGIAAGYLAAGLAAVIRLRTSPRPSALGRAGWVAVAISSVSLVAYLVIESTVAVERAVAGRLAAFEFWYGTVAVWTWSVSWPVFFAGLAVIALQARRVPLTPPWTSVVAAVAAAWATLAPVFSATGLDALGLSTFLSPIAVFVWLAAFTYRRARAGRAIPADAWQHRPPLAPV